VERDHPAGNQWYLLKKKERKKKPPRVSGTSVLLKITYIHTQGERVKDTETERGRERERERQRNRETQGDI
jgi:hypothetical protein